MGVPFLLLLGTGCVQTHRSPPLAYYASPPAAATLTPTSEGPVPRVYAPGSPPDVSADDLVAAQAVSDLLRGNTYLAGTAENILFTVKNGVVTLKGSTVSEHERFEIVNRVKSLPGVTRVDDHLSVTGTR